ncbi:MAG: sugar ABC transporter permease [Rhodobacteraceae bacterium]|nr:sugar ABC transporter permease [Paracoccaceae bacterium]
MTRGKPTYQSPWLYLVPTIAILAVSAVYPLIQAFALSLYDLRWGETASFVWFKNFGNLLSDHRVWKVFGRTALFSVSSVAIELALGLLFALAVDRLAWGQGIVRTMIILPLMISGIATSLIWKVLLDPASGLVNYVLSLGGVTNAPAWFGSPSMALPSLVLVDTWWQTGFAFIVLAAAIKGLPADTFEAAKIDGASSFQAFRYITLPLLLPVIGTIAIFRLIDTLKVFDIVFGTTGGGPAQSTEMIQTFAYRTAFKFLELGRSSAIMVIFSTIFILICALLIFRAEKTTTR